MVIQTSNRSVSTAVLKLGPTSGSGSFLTVHTVSLTAFKATYTANFTLQRSALNSLSWTSGQSLSLWTALGSNSLTSTGITYSFTPSDILTFKPNPYLCTYGSSCSFKWTSSNPYARANVYYNLGTTYTTVSRSSGSVVLSDTGTALTACATSLAPGTFPIAANGTSHLHYGKYEVFLVLTEDDSSGLRYLANSVNVQCKSLYYGTYCSTKQSVSRSMYLGIFFFFCAILITFVIFWGEWLNRIHDLLCVYVTEASVALVRSVRYQSPVTPQASAGPFSSWWAPPVSALVADALAVRLRAVHPVAGRPGRVEIRDHTGRPVVDREPESHMCSESRAAPSELET